jgi:hypothetical protein
MTEAQKEVDQIHDENRPPEIKLLKFGYSIRLVIQGNFGFKPDHFFGLKPGERIVQIGCGRENGVIRTDRFISSVEYMGSLIIEDKKYYAMHLDRDVYLLYRSTVGDIPVKDAYTREDGEIYTHTGIELQYPRFYAPQFIRA